MLRNKYENDLIGIDTYCRTVTRGGVFLEKIKPSLFANKIEFIIEPFNRHYTCFAVNYKDDDWEVKIGKNYYRPTTLYGSNTFFKVNKHKKGDVAMEIEISFLISKEEAQNVKTIRVRGL